MLKGLFKRETAEQRFWRWFQTVSDDFFLMSEENQEELFDLFHKHLQKVHKELVFEFSSNQDSDGKREIVFSADGLRELIPFVLKLVNTAPNLKLWKITAFRQRMEGMEISYNGYRLSEDNIFFSYQFTSEKNFIHVQIYVEDYEEDMTGALFLLLDSCLGEYEVMTKLGNIHFSDIKERDMEEIYPLSKLYDLVKEVR
jgi:hypothetical protein